MRKLVDLKLYSYLSENYLPNLNWTSLEDAFDILDKHNVSIISFSDFNLFKLSFYRNLISKSKEYKHKFVIFPGLELYIEDEKNKFKVLFIFDYKYSEADFEQLQITINEFFNENKKGIKLGSFIIKIKKFKYEMILDLNNCENIDIKEIKKISPKINYVIADSENKWYKTVCDEIKKEVKNLIFYESNNWEQYNAPKTFIDVANDDEEITFEYLFNNLKCV